MIFSPSQDLGSSCYSKYQGIYPDYCDLGRIFDEFSQFVDEILASFLSINTIFFGCLLTVQYRTCYKALTALYYRENL